MGNTRKKIAAANWKMNKTRGEAKMFARSLAEKFSGSEILQAVEAVIFPPFTAIDSVRAETENSSITVGAQDVFYEEKGAYTGEISCRMLIDAGCETVIVGHSERRQMFGETDEAVAAKVRAAHCWGLKTVLCVGETEREKSAGVAKKVVGSQLKSALAGASPEMTTVAYEPIWAIGTGKNADGKEIARMRNFISETLFEIFGGDSKAVRILYGGSATPENTAEIIGASGTDGMLVGTASLDADSFASIIRKISAS